MNLNNADKRLWQSLQSINSYKTAIDATRPACHVLSVFRSNSPSVSQSNRSIAPIDISCRINNQGFCKQLSSYTKVAIFSSKHWAGWVHFWLHFQFCEWPLWRALKSPAQRKCRRVNESESNEECHCLDWSWNFNTDVSETFLNLAVHYPLDLHLNEFAKRCTL